jgi:hypothetical protein
MGTKGIGPRDIDCSLRLLGGYLKYSSNLPRYLQFYVLHSTLYYTRTFVVATPIRVYQRRWG